MRKKITEKQVGSWEEFKNIYANNVELEWIFRGQSNASWPIKTSLRRSGILEIHEERMLFEFKKACQYYLTKNENPTTLIDWLALLQHHGTPTRLIDFTSSPYIAAFFAFEDSNDYGENVSIWIANKIYFLQKSKDFLLKEKIKVGEMYNIISDETFRIIFEQSKMGKLDFVIPIDSHFMNKRYYLQQSIFLSPSNPYKDFNEQLDFLGTTFNHALFKVNIPRIERKKALRDLQKMNITYASLFPGIDGYAKSLKMKFNTLTSIREVAETKKKPF